MNARDIPPLHVSPSAFSALMDALAEPIREAANDDLIEEADRHQRIEAGLQCPRCGTRNADDYIASVVHGGGIPMFECYAPGCREREGSLCSWFDVREDE